MGRETWRSLAGAPDCGAGADPIGVTGHWVAPRGAHALETVDEQSAAAAQDGGGRVLTSLGYLRMGGRSSQVFHDSSVAPRRCSPNRGKYVKLRLSLQALRLCAARRPTQQPGSVS